MSEKTVNLIQCTAEQLTDTDGGWGGGASLQ